MSLNEDDFINQFIKHLSFDKLVTIPPGDDCAELSLGPTKLLLAVDQLSADIHYLKATTPPIRIGHKLLARNLSDIAAMGGVPNYALMTIALTEDHSDEFLTEMSDGVRLLAEQHDVQIIGGDFGKAKTDHFTLTIIGHAKYTAIRRNNAEVDDIVAVTGVLGNSFQSGHHLTFTPRIKEGQFLAQNGIHSMIDISDGLLKDCNRILNASEASAELNVQQLPLRRGASIQQALTEGEDYELLFTCSKTCYELIQKNWPFETKLTQIGRIKSGQGGCILNGHDVSNLSTFEHFD